MKHGIFKIRRGTEISYRPEGAKKGDKAEKLKIIGWLAKDDGNYYQLSDGEKTIEVLCSKIN